VYWQHVVGRECVLAVCIGMVCVLAARHRYGVCTGSMS